MTAKTDFRVCDQRQVYFCVRLLHPHGGMVNKSEPKDDRPEDNLRLDSSDEEMPQADNCGSKDTKSPPPRPVVPAFQLLRQQARIASAAWPFHADHEEDYQAPCRLVPDLLRGLHDRQNRAAPGRQPQPVDSERGL